MKKIILATFVTLVSFGALAENVNTFLNKTCDDWKENKGLVTQKIRNKEFTVTSEFDIKYYSEVEMTGEIKNWVSFSYGIKDKMQIERKSLFFTKIVKNEIEAEKYLNKSAREATFTVKINNLDPIKTSGLRSCFISGKLK